MFDSAVLKNLSFHAKNSLKEAERIAKTYHAPSVCPKHLFIAIFLEKGSLGASILKDIGINEKSYDSLIFEKKAKRRRHIEFSPAIKDILTRAYSIASSSNFPYVGTEHLVYALIDTKDPDIQKILQKTTPPKRTKGTQTPQKPSASPLAYLSKFFESQGLGIAGIKEDSYDEGISALEQFCIDLNQEVHKDARDPLIGRDKELTRLINILGRKNKNNAILIGEPGVGKTALAYGLAERIEAGKVPSSLLGKKILELDMALIISGTSFRGEFESRLKEIIQEVHEDPTIILFIDEIHTVVGAGNTNGSLDAANILKPALARGELRCIGATTFTEYKKYFEKDPALERRFQPIVLTEPSAKDTKKILTKLRKNFEKFHRVPITPEAIEAAVNLSIRYIPERFLPDKAFDILDESASAKRNTASHTQDCKKRIDLEKSLEQILQEKEGLIKTERYEEAAALRTKETTLLKKITTLKKKCEALEKKNISPLTREDIIQTIANLTDIPAEKIAQKTSHTLRNLEKKLSQKVIGQNQATEKIAHILLRSYSGLTDEKKPLGSFLILGPTGVGKTHTAKVIAQEVFGSIDALIRVNMSEFQERHSISSLIGSPAGYVGYGEGGQFTEKVRRRPYSVILFDEIEKAHPDILNILLQILEEGEITDSEGRHISFANTIILLTSNIGSQDFLKTPAGFRFGESPEEFSSPEISALESKLHEELKQTLKPEILSRFDAILTYHPLDATSIQKITREELKKTTHKLQELGYTWKVSPKVIHFIAQKSLKQYQGARLVRQNIQKYIENTLAAFLIEHDTSKTELSLTLKNKKIAILAK